MINFNKQNDLNCQIKENIQKIELYRLTSYINKNNVIVHLELKNIRLSKEINKIKEKGGVRSG